VRDLSPTQYRHLGDCFFRLESFLHQQHRSARLGLRPADCDLMLAIKCARWGKSMTSGALARHMQTDSVAESLHRLEKRKLVRRHRDHTYRGVVLVRITPAGENMLRKLVRSSVRDLQREGLTLTKAITRAMGRIGFVGRHR